MGWGFSAEFQGNFKRILRELQQKAFHFSEKILIFAPNLRTNIGRDDTKMILQERNFGRDCTKNDGIILKMMDFMPKNRGFWTQNSGLCLQRLGMRQFGLLFDDLSIQVEKSEICFTECGRKLISNEDWMILS